MSAHSRTKGAAFERSVAKDLFLLTGITFRRNLTQYQQCERDDLTPDNPAWPFSCELKRRATGINCLAAWKAQAEAAARKVGKHPAVIFRFDRQATRCAIPLSAICPAWPADEWAEVTLQGFCAIAREMMAGGGNVR